MKIIGYISFLATLALTWITYHQHQELIELREYKQREMIALQLRRRISSEKLINSKSDHRAKEDVIPNSAHTNVDRSSAAVSVNASAPEKKELVASWLAMVNDRELVRLTADRERAEIEAHYGGLIGHLGLTEDQAVRFKDLLLEKKNVFVDLSSSAEAANSESLQDVETFNAAVKDARSQINGQIQAILGPSGYNQYLQFTYSQSSQGVVTQIQHRLGASDTPLTDSQSAQLQEVLSQNGGHSTDNVIMKAQSFLTSSQLEALKQVQESQQTVDKLRQKYQQDSGTLLPLPMPSH